MVFLSLFMLNMSVLVAHNLLRCTRSR
jgi:hypothetical protein